MDIKHIEQQVLNFIHMVEHKLPTMLETAAEVGLKYTKLAEQALTGTAVVDLATLVPEVEPFREGILAVLAELDVAFKAVGGAFQKGTLATAGAEITKVLLPGLPNNHYNIAFQEVYSKSVA